MDFILPRKYLSASSIGTFLRCPKSFEFKYVKNTRTPSNAAMSIGTAFHKTMEKYFTGKLHGVTPMVEADIKDYSVGILEETLERDELVVPEQELNEFRGQLTDSAVSYANNVAQYLDPVGIEEEVRYDSECGVQILAYLDLRRSWMPWEEEQRLADGLSVDTSIICDYKVTAKKWSLGQLTNSLQFNLYHLCTGVSRFEIHNVVKTNKIGKIAPRNILTVEPSQDVNTKSRILRNTFEDNENAHYENLIAAVATQITSGLFPPCDPGNWSCSPKWCPFYKECRGSGNKDAVYFT